MINKIISDKISKGEKQWCVLIDPDKMGSLFKVIAITKTKRHLEGLN